MSLLRRILRFFRPQRCDCAGMKAACVTMTEAMAERWRLEGVPELEAEFRDLAKRMGCLR